jgi:hypothetical protein
MNKVEKEALLDTVAIIALGICAVVAFCLSIDWLKLYLFPIVIVVLGVVAFGFLSLAVFELRVKSITKRTKRNR